MVSKNSIQSDRTQRLLAICGIIGPIVYTIVLVTLGSLQPDYNHITQTMSELGAVDAPYAIVMNTAGLPLLGLLIIAFAIALNRGIRDGINSKIGPTLVAVSGAALVMTGIFPCDPGCVNVSIVGTLHSIFAMVAAFAMILALLSISQRLKKDRQWQGYTIYSLITLVVALSLSAVYGLNILEPWSGALQRASMGVLLLWMEVVAIKLVRLSKPKAI